MITKPSKIHKFIEVFEKEITNQKVKESLVYLTDFELVYLINSKLDEKDRIDRRTFERWKAKHKGESTDGIDELDEVGARFVALYKGALIQMKVGLFQKLVSPSETQWQRYAWIIERKFDEWNIRQKSETDINVKQKEITIIKRYDKK